MTYKCLECGEIIGEDELIECQGDSYEYFGLKGRTSYKGCPVCESSDLEEIYRKEMEY